MGADIRQTNSTAASEVRETADAASGPNTQRAGFIRGFSFSCIITNSYMERWLVDVHNCPISRSRESISWHQYAPDPLLWLVAAVTDKTETFDKHIQEPSILVWA